MAKFDKKHGAGSGPRRDKPRFSEESKEGSKKSDYKAKRSFTRNKSIRGKEKTQGDKPYRPFERSYSGGNKPAGKKFGRRNDESPSRRTKHGDFEEGRKFSSENKSEKFEGNKGPRKNASAERNYSGDRKPARSKFNRPNDEAPSRRFKQNGSEEGRKYSSDKNEKYRSDKGPGKSASTERNHSGDRKPARSKFNKHGDDASAKRVKYGDFEEGKSFSSGNKSDKFKNNKGPKKSAPVAKQASADGLIRLNKYLSNAGVASRREADVLIQSGAVKVNGVVVDQLGYKIKPDDKVSYGDSAVKSERKVYLLLNKPKDYITTVEDPQDRKTVMQLIEGACRERVYPVGRLDRNTTGLLLFTNDGELTTRLTHPKFGVKKVYHVSLNKGLKPDDFKAMIEGVELEDGLVKADDLAFVGEGKKEIGIEIHSGRNRIVRRLFEHLGYDVIKLDRVVFAGLTKKDLPRGKYRFLTGKEVSFLHMLG